MVEVVQEGKKIVLGRYDENITRVKKFNIGNLLANYPDATYTLLNKRPGDEAAYIVAASHCAIEGNCFLWTIHREDVAKQGKGRCELRLQRGEEVFLSYIWDTEIWESLSGTGTPPDPWETWLQELINASVDVTDAVEEAKSTLEGYVSDAESARDDAITAKNSAESANADAQTAKGIAESSGQAAAQAKQDAESAASSASSSASDASDYAERAETAASAAESAKSEAQTAAATATSKAADASRDAEGLAEAVTAATSAAQTATAKASIATSSADSASASAISAAQSEENAADSEEAAESAASSAAASATSASSAATTATGKANEASASAATASAKASEAAQSALNAAGSATSAGTYASSAQGSASEASGSANRAETAATNAYTSATAASSAASSAQTAKTDAETAASTATTKASAAAQSATDAGAAATAAAGSAGTAATKAGEAAESATAAAGSAEDAAEALADFQEEKADLEESVINVNNALTHKQDSPSTAGTAGQVLALDDNLDPVWTDPSVDVSELAPVIKSSASGEIASFADGADNRVIDSLVVNIEPVQDLHGYDNPWPAGGGKNKFTTIGEEVGKYINGDGNIGSNEGWIISDYIPVTPSTQYTFTPNSSSGDSAKHCYFDTNKSFLSCISSGQQTFTTPSDCAFMRFSYRGNGNSHDIQLELGSATSWTPYSNECPISGWTGANIKHSDAVYVDYQRVEYLESNGTQYIATGIVPTNALGYSLDFMALSPIGTSNYGCVMGGRVGSLQKDLQVTSYSSNPAVTLGTMRCGNSSDELNAGIIQGTRQTVSLRNRVATNAAGVQKELTSIDWSGAKEIYLFGLNNNGQFAQSGNGCRIYDLMFYNDDALYRHFIPVKRISDGVAGMYETETATFFTNSGSGSFITGPLYANRVYPISWSSQAGVVPGGWFTIKGDGTVRLVVDSVLEVFDIVDGSGNFTSSLGINYLGTSGSVSVIGDYARISFAVNGQVDQTPYNRISNTYTKQLCNMLRHYFSYNDESSHWYRNTILYVYFPTALVGSTVESVKNYLISIKDTNPLSFWLPLNTPIIYDLPSVTALKTLLGQNNIWADCGSIRNVQYSADTKLYIDGKLAQLAAQIVS